MSDEHDVVEAADADDLLCVIVDADARVAHLEVGSAHVVTGRAEQWRDALPVPRAAAGAVDEDERPFAQKPRPSEPRSPSEPRFSFVFASSSADCSAAFTAASTRSSRVSGILGVDRFFLDLDLGDLAGAGRFHDEAPPPAVPSTTSFSISSCAFCICSCIC